MKKIVVVILNWNGGDVTRRCLESLRQSDCPDIQSLVVDNGSTDGSIEAIAGAFPEVGILRNASNLGFAAASNQGAKWGLDRGADYILMLNNDTRVDPAMISNMMTCATEHGGRAAVIPKIYWESDPTRLWFTVGRVSLWTGIFSNIAYNRVDDGSFDSCGEAEYASGCCILMPREIVREVGGFDPEYFAYVEDIDWSLRCRGAGFSLILCPTAKLWHAVSHTQKRQPARVRYLITRNHLWTVRRHASLVQLVCCVLLVPLRSVWRIVKIAAGGQWACVAGELRGVRDGLLGRLPKGDFTISSATE